jgi:purine-binding chemotaxis protein CheW
LVGFVVGEVAYAIEILQVKEIINPLQVVALPRAPASIVGVADYRGDVVPVIDLRIRFGLQPSMPTRRTKWIVVDVGSRFVALVVDAVTEVFGTGGQELRPAPALGGGEQVRGIRGVTMHARKMVFVLDTMPFAHMAESLAESGALDGGIASLQQERSGAQ